MRSRVMGFLTAAGLMLTACNSPLLSHQDEKQNGPATPTAAALFFSSVGAYAQLEWTTGPTANGESDLIVTFVAADGARVNVPDMRLYLWMPEMGHGSSPVTVKNLGLGQFAVSNIFFIMPGTWEVHIQVESDEQIVKVSL